MTDSTQTIASTLSSIRDRLFGVGHRPTDKSDAKLKSSNVKKSDLSASEEKDNLDDFHVVEECQNRLWKDRWDAAPDDWKHFVVTMDKVFGLTGVEEEKIAEKNKTYVETPDLTRRGRLGTSAIILTVGTISKLLLRSMNTLHTHKISNLHNAIENRSAHRGLLTFSNHQSVMDDPFLLGALLPSRILVNAKLMRWGLCTLDICFQSAWVSRTLRLGKALPIQRRGGMSQPFLHQAAAKLAAGDWVHIFPEGRVRQTGMGYSKRGVGKLLAMAFEACGSLPLIIPLYHEGIENVMPQNTESNELKSLVPRSGKSLFVVMGDPVDVSHIFDRMMPECEASGGTRMDKPPCIRLYEEIADFMGIIIRLLRADARKHVMQEHNVNLGRPYEFS